MLGHIGIPKYDERMKDSNLKTRAYSHIRQKMVRGSLVSGNRISEIELAGELGISRTPVREAIRQLESEGFVRQVPRFGTFIRRLSVEDFERMWELRELLESYAAEHAALRISDSGLKKLGEFCDQSLRIAHKVRDEKLGVDEVAKMRIVQDSDMDFHKLIMESADNHFILKINDNYSLMTKLMMQAHPAQALSALHVEAYTFLDHYRIYRAIKKRDCQAAGFWMRQHLRKAFKSAIEFFKEQEHKRKQSGENFDQILADIDYYGMK
jgi:DNA-binding GntR family transcriptional regulator